MTTQQKIVATISGVLIFCGVIFFARRSGDEVKKPYRTETLSTKDLTQYINSSGVLQAEEQITIGSLVAGRVVEILADDNDEVHKDQVLARLDDGINYSGVKALEGLLREAQANLVYQRAFYERQRKLFASGQISKDDFERFTRDIEVAEGRVRNTEGELEIRKQRYNNQTIRTPSAGVVISKKIDLGQMITSVLQATELFIIAKDLTKMEVKVNVDEADVGLVAAEQEVIFDVDTYPKQSFHGKVKHVQYLAQTIENVVTFGTIVEVPNPDMRLRPGMTANVDVKVGQARGVQAITNKAQRINRVALAAVAKSIRYSYEPLAEANGKHPTIDAVWIVRGKRFVETAVRLGVNDGKYAEVREGLAANDRVLIEIEEPRRENPFLKTVFARKGI